MWKELKLLFLLALIVLASTAPIKDEEPSENGGEENNEQNSEQPEQEKQDSNEEEGTENEEQNAEERSKVGKKKCHGCGGHHFGGHFGHGGHHIGRHVGVLAVPEAVDHGVTAVTHNHEYPHVVSHGSDHYAVDTHVAAHTGHTLGGYGCGHGYGGVGYGGVGYGGVGYGGAGYGHGCGGYGHGHVVHPVRVHHVHHAEPCRPVHVLHGSHHGCGHGFGLGHGAYVSEDHKAVETTESKSPNKDE